MQIFWVFGIASLENIIADLSVQKSDYIESCWLNSIRIYTSDVSEVKFRGSAEVEAEVSFSKNADADVVAEVMESFFAEAEA